MPILDIAGKKVEVGPEFMQLSPQEQEDAVDEIYNSFSLPNQGVKPATVQSTDTQPVVSQNREMFPGMQPSAARASITPTANLFDMSQPVDLTAQSPADQAAGLAQTAQDIANADPTGARGLAGDRPFGIIPSAYDFQNIRKGAVDLADMVVDPLLFNYRLSKDALVGNMAPNEVPLAASTLNTMVSDQVPTIPDESMSRYDRLAGAAVRGGTSGLLGGAILKLADAPAYIANASKAIMGDTLAGAGSNLAAQEYTDAMPQEWQQKIGPLGQIIASILGGGAGATVNSTAHSLYDWSSSSLRDTAAAKFGMFTDPSIPVNPDTGIPFKPSEVDMAARIGQNMPTDLEKTVANIRAGQQEFGNIPADAQPTTAMLANDVGMSVNENAARADPRNAQRFIERDTNRNAFASNQIDKTVPVGAEGQNMVDTMTNQYDATLGAAKNKLETAKVAEALGAEDIAKQNAALKEAQLRQGDASAALDAEFRNKNAAATTEKNALYDAVPNDTPVSGQQVSDALDAIDATVPRAAQQGTDYANAVGRIRGLIEGTDPTTGDPVVRDLTYGDAKILKTEIGALRRDAVAAGRDVSQLDKLNAMVADVVNTANPEAARNYAENFAPKFRTGKAGEYSQSLKRAVKTGEESSATRPTEFGQKFLAKPEDAAALQRAVDVNGNPVTAQNATEWMMGDLAKSNVLNNNAEIRYDRFKQWADKNKAVIDQFPEMRSRVDTELARAANGGRLSKQLSNDVRNAETNLNMTETDLRRSALQKAIGNNPKNTVDGIMNSGDPERMMSDLVTRLGPDKKATDGLKDAMREWMRDEAGTTSRNVGHPDTYKYSRAKLDKLFRDHEKTLAKVYTPEEMNSLRQVHSLLDVAANLDVKAGKDAAAFERFLSAGENTTTKRYRMLEAALKAKYGVLKGGGLFRTTRLFFDAIGSMSSRTGNVQNIITDAWFNPDLARHLLTRNVKEIGTPAWNVKLNRLLSVAAGNRSNIPVENNEQKDQTK